MSNERGMKKYLPFFLYLKPFFSPPISLYEITACACLEQVASLRSARQAHATRTKLTKLYSENKGTNGRRGSR